MTLFRDLKRQLRDLESPRTMQDLHNIAGRAASELVAQGFAQARDPDGVPWAPTKRRNPILVDSKALRDGIRWKADSRGLVIRTTGKANEYAAFHQDGTRGRTRALDKRGRFRSDRSTNRLKRSVRIVYIPGLPARKFLPREGAIPAAWAARIENDFRTYFRQRYGGS